MEFSVSFDYLTITGKHDFSFESSIFAHRIAAGALMARMEELGIEHSRVWKSGSRHPFYEFTFRDDDYKIDAFMSIDGETQGWMIRLGGEALRMQPYPDRIIIAAKRTGCRVTRLDVAFDFIGCEETTDVVYAAYEGRQPGGRTLKTQVVYSSTGTTFYLGSRSSERMLRIYDKGRQQGLDVTWTRIELELKGALANLNAEAIASNQRIAAAMITDILPLRGLRIVDTLADYADGTDVEIVRARAPESDTVRWFRTQVLAAFKNLLERDRDAAINILEEYEAAVLEHERLREGNEEGLRDA
jgi:DNA relaxase NicK